MSNKKTNPNDTINAIVETSSYRHGDVRMDCTHEGLTKREYFAAMAMQGLINKTPCCYYNLIGEESLQIADELIKALNK